MDGDVPSFPVPTRDELNRGYWEALDQGRLVFQRCASCGNAWLPPRQECPKCLRAAWNWEQASGKATLVSWIVVHRAFHPAFASRVPYNVAIVALVEGPRLLSNIVGVDDPETLCIDQPLELTVEQEHGVAIPRFRPLSQPQTAGQYGA